MILDLHNHTRWSFDCSMDPAKVVRLAKARGIDAIAITDHDQIAWLAVMPALRTIARIPEADPR